MAEATTRQDQRGTAPRRHVRRAALVGLVAVAALAGGCGSSPGPSSAAAQSSTSSASSGRAGASGGSGSSAASAASTGSGTAGSAASAGSGPPPVYEVSTGTVKGLGTVLVDGQGMTLYLFAPDRQSGKSTCYGECAEAWPPLLLPAGVSTPLAGPGVQASLLGTTQRTDGTTELTYDGWPLYLWVNDSQPGQATGQGLNNLGGLWYVLSPDGRAITTALPSSGG